MANYKKYLGKVFESNMVRTKKYIAFERFLKKDLEKNALSNGLEIIDFAPGHFYFSAFLQNPSTKKIAYISIPDVRFAQDGWYYKVLYRTAKDSRDYIGGRNQYSSWENLIENIIKITS